MAVATVLLDTSTLLWSLLDPAALGQGAAAVIRDPETVLLVSSASAWELGIKRKLGKLSGATRVLDDLPSHLSRLGAAPLVITHEHAVAAGALPLRHRDPFDRMLVAQAQLEGVPIATNDAAIAGYEVDTIW